MNIYEIVIFVLWVVSTSILIWIVDYLKDKIKELDDKIERLHMLHDGNYRKLERLENDIYTLMDRK